MTRYNLYAGDEPLYSVSDGYIQHQRNDQRSGEHYKRQCRVVDAYGVFTGKAAKDLGNKEIHRVLFIHLRFASE